jgi:hypothetical protein
MSTLRILTWIGGCEPTAQADAVPPAVQSEPIRILAEHTLRPSDSGPHPFEGQSLSARGVGFVHATDEARMANGDPFADLFAGGAGACDWDGDGCLDIFFANHGASELYAGRCDGTWELQPPGPWALLDRHAHAVACPDIDRDGDPDLHVVVTYGEDDALLENESLPGDFRFVDRIADTPLRDADRTSSATWADVDANGLADVFLANYYGADSGTAVASRLLLQTDPWSFVDASDRLPADEVSGMGWNAGFADVDGDTRLDLLLINDKDHFRPSVLLLDRCTGTERPCYVPTPDAGFHPRVDGMGLQVGDLDGDLSLDVLVTGVDECLLHQDPATGRFVDVGAAWGLPLLDFGWMSWSGAFLDIDGDRDADVLYGVSEAWACFEHGTPGTCRGQNRILWNDGPEALRQEPDLFPFEMNRSFVFLDIDDDGAPDVLATNAGTTSAPQAPSLWRNTATRGHRAVLRFREGGAGPLPHGVILRVSSPSGRQRLDLGGVGPVGVAGPVTAWIGLGEDTYFDVEIAYPLGRVERLTGLQAGRAYELGW